MIKKTTKSDKSFGYLKSWVFYCIKLLQLRYYKQYIYFVLVNFCN